MDTPITTEQQEEIIKVLQIIVSDIESEEAQKAAGHYMLLGAYHALNALKKAPPIWMINIMCARTDRHFKYASPCSIPIGICIDGVHLSVTEFDRRVIRLAQIHGFVSDLESFEAHEDFDQILRETADKAVEHLSDKWDDGYFYVEHECLFHAKY